MGNSPSEMNSSSTGPEKGGEGGGGNACNGFHHHLHHLSRHQRSGESGPGTGNGLKSIGKKEHGFTWSKA